MQIEDVGELIPWAEFWWLKYDKCGHNQYFPRTRWNYADQDVRAEVLRYYADCTTCTWPRNASIPAC